jgi:hypothetical protein
VDGRSRYTFTEPARSMIYAGDGQRISKWGRLLEKANLPSTMIGESIHARTAISGQMPYDRCYPLPIAQPPSTNKQLQRRVGKCLWT